MGLIYPHMPLWADFDDDYETEPDYTFGTHCPDCGEPRGVCQCEDNAPPTYPWDIPGYYGDEL